MRFPQVTVLDGFDVGEASLVITLEPKGFALWSGSGVKVAESESARALSKWALELGALRVKHAYDLKYEK